jgi:hypothetical protein
MNLARTGDLVLGRVASALRPLAVTPDGELVLGILKDAGRPCPPGYISEQLIVSRATVTGVVRPAGQARCRASRVKSYRPADVDWAPYEGRLSHGRQGPPYAASREPEWMRALNDHERAQLTEFLGKLQKHLALWLSAMGPTLGQPPNGGRISVKTPPRLLPS